MTAAALLVHPNALTTHAWRRTLQLIAERPGIAVHEIAAERRVDRKAALLTVRTLEGRGLITTALQGHRPHLRCACTLTPAGRAALERQP